MSNEMTKIKSFFADTTCQERLRSIVPQGVAPDRLMRMALLSIAKTPKLQQCSAESLFMAVCDAAALGLDCGGSLGAAYLVPYKEKCTLIVGYRGMVQLARKSGEISRVEAACVRNGDEFEWEYGTKPVFRHRPGASCEDKDISHAWAMATFKDGSYQLDVLQRAEIEKVRRRSKAAGEGPWVTDYAEMCKKTAIRRLCKLLPMTPEAVEAIDKSDAAEIDLSIPVRAPATVQIPQRKLAVRPTEMQTDRRESVAEVTRREPTASSVAQQDTPEPGSFDGEPEPTDYLAPDAPASTMGQSVTGTPQYLNEPNGKKPASIKMDGEFYSFWSESLWEKMKLLGKQRVTVYFEVNDKGFKTAKDVITA